MNKYHRVTPEEEGDIIRMYSIDLERAADIAHKFNITRQSVYKILARNGVETKKQRISVTCNVCGKETHKTRAQLRKAIRVYCSRECYDNYLSAVHTGFGYRNGSRIARKVVSEAWAGFKPEYIVHHKDGNPWNNEVSNLVVVANNGDHIRLHRGAEVPILWQHSA